MLFQSINGSWAWRAKVALLMEKLVLGIQLQRSSPRLSWMLLHAWLNWIIWLSQPRPYGNFYRLPSKTVATLASSLICSFLFSSAYFTLGIPQGCHGSYQNEVLWPFPMTLLIQWVYLSLTHSILYQESPGLGLTSQSDFPFKITVCIYFTQSPSWFSHIFHMLFIIQALLTNPRSCIPRPPLSLGWQIMDPLPLALLELSHKKDFRIFSHLPNDSPWQGKRGRPVSTKRHQNWIDQLKSSSIRKVLYSLALHSMIQSIH